MGTVEDHPATRSNESPINATLLKLIHHELGNGLAVIAGYRHLLQRAIARQIQEAVPPELETWRQQNEQWLGYLQTMHEREKLLNDFLAQLRELSPGAASEPFCRNMVQADLVVVLGRVIERLVPLFIDQSLRVSLPGRALFVQCDLFWLGLVLEHVLSHTISACPAFTPVEITLAPSTNPAYSAQEAIIALWIGRADPAASRSEREDAPESWAPALSQSDWDLCFAMCREVLQEHGGRIWREWGKAQEELIFLALPLKEESQRRNG